MAPRACTKSSDTDKRKSALVSSSAWDGELRSSPTASNKAVIAARPAAAENLEGFEHVTGCFPHLGISFPGSRAHAVGLRPHSAERLEQVGDRRALRAQRVDAVLLGREQVALRIEHLELTGHAVLVAKARKPQRGPQCRSALALGFETLARLGLRHQRVAHVAACVLDRKLVLRERLAFARAGGLHLRSEEHTSELQSRSDLVCRLLLEKKKKHTSRCVARSHPRTAEPAALVSPPNARRPSEIGPTRHSHTGRAVSCWYHLSATPALRRI